MKHRRGWDRHQGLLLPERLEEYIAPDNPVRFVDAFAASLDLRALGFAKATVQNTGSPPYDPADLVRLHLYGYLHRVRSSRLLEAECQRNVEVLWLLGKLAPDHKTIADFRKDNPKALQGVTRQFTLLCKNSNSSAANWRGLMAPSSVRSTARRPTLMKRSCRS